jgi:SAM-dependent methyltransferase
MCTNSPPTPKWSEPSEHSVDSPPLTSREYYDRLSDAYEGELRGRAAYIHAVDKLVIDCCREVRAVTILDVGCGNGSRLENILRQTAATGTGVDESPRMAAAARARGLDAYALDIAAPLPAGSLQTEHFDIVIALWNVLGHIPSHAARVAALRNMRLLLRPGGMLLFDVNNRYNAGHYGWRAAARNWLYDRFTASHSGDFLVRRSIGGMETATTVRVFSLREVRALCREAGLQPVRTHFISYRSGKQVRTHWFGQICLITTPVDGLDETYTG